MPFYFLIFFVEELFQLILFVLRLQAAGANIHIFSVVLIISYPSLECKRIFWGKELNCYFSLFLWLFFVLPQSRSKGDLLPFFSLDRLYVCLLDIRGSLLTVSVLIFYLVSCNYYTQKNGAVGLSTTPL